MTIATPAVAVVTDSAAKPAELLDLAVGAIALGARTREALGKKGSNGQVVIVPAMNGFAVGSPAMTDPALVEHLIDRFYEFGADTVIVGATEASDALWAENRDVLMRADLLGYRFVTPGGRDYDVIDLAEDAQGSPFPPSCAVAGIALSAIWRDAAFRVLFAGSRTDTADGYALTLDTLLSVLPGRDKDSLYLRQRDPGAVVRALLAATPVDAALVDACFSSHGQGGRARPLSIETSTVIAASSPLLADQAGALKMGLDPQVSRLWHAPEASENIGTIGSLLPFDRWINVSPMAREAARQRGKDAALDRSAWPVLQDVDVTLFPFRNEANARLNKWLQPILSKDCASGHRTFALLEIALAQIAEARAAWQVIFAKDAIVRSSAALNVCVEDIDEAQWSKVAATIAGYRALLHGCNADEEGLRWRMVDGAVLFDCVRRFPVPLSTFAAAVPINRTIQYMNDYIGGEALTISSDQAGNVTRQLERNLYLPQPNFTALLDGDVIDVTKIETLTFAEGSQVMAWQTLFSENMSALADDGLVEFAGIGDDTVVTIFARQQFRQPPLVKAIDLTLFPQLHAWLIADAYHLFARRTFANLEAVLEGREVRIGRPAAQVEVDEPLPIDGIVGFVERLRDDLPDNWTEALQGSFDWNRSSQPVPVQVDVDGLRHFRPITGTEAKVERPKLPTGLLSGAYRAIATDLGLHP